MKDNRTENYFSLLSDAIRKVLIDIEDKRGSFSFVALQQYPEDSGKYLVTVSAPWIINTDEISNTIGGAIENNISDELLNEYWAGVRALKTDDPWVQEFSRKAETQKFEKVAKMFHVAPYLRCNNIYVFGSGDIADSAIMALDIKSLKSKTL